MSPTMQKILEQSRDTLSTYPTVIAHEEIVKKYNDALMWAVQLCYNEAILVESGEGEVAKAIASKFPFIQRVQQDSLDLPTN